MSQLNRIGRKRTRVKKLLAGLMVGVVGLAAAGMVYESIAAAAAWRNYPPPGQLVEVGGYRLHLHVMGEDRGLPTVIMENGATGISAQWGWVQPAVARHTRVVTYDRPGMGWSDTPPGQMDAQEAIQDLYEALRQSGVKGPYLLTGHSMGALMARVFAHFYPEEVVGLVLVDPRDVTWEGVHAQEPEMSPLVSRTLALAGRLGIVRLYGAAAADIQGLPPMQMEAARAIAYSYHHIKNIEQEGYLGDSAAALLLERGETLEGVPLIVLSASGPGTVFNPQQRQALNALHGRLAARSTLGTHRIVPGADHVSITTYQEHAQAITDAILELVLGRSQ